MTQRILVLGMNTFDSGKTVLSKMIAKTLIKQGLACEYLKPISGHNYWYKNEHTQRCLKNSSLVSLDAYRVREALTSRVPLELANPIHSFFAPALLDRPGISLATTLALGGWDSVLTLQRYSRPIGKGTESFILMATELIEAKKVMLTKEEANKLTKNSEIVSFDKIETIEEYASENLEDTLTSALRIIEEEADYLIIEGFNDSAWPWEGLDRVDKVIVTGPGHVYLYDPERFRRAVFLLKYGSQPIREVPFSRLTDMIKPIDGLYMQPQTGFTDSQIVKLGLNEKE